MAFIPPKILQEQTETVKYVSGYSEEEEQRIKAEKIKIEFRDLDKFPVTLEEFKTIICPWFRINRTEVFILNNVKEKVPRIKKEKIVKPKKLTKKQAQEKFKELIMKMAKGEEFSEEETLFYNSHTGT
jgi:hypothetical protein